MPKVNGLTQKQRLFVENYLINWNGTVAARNAGYRGDDNVLAVTSYDNLRKPIIQEAIQRGIEELSASNQALILEAVNHFQEHGRRISDGMRQNRGIVYVVREEYGTVKIGKTISLLRRFATIDTQIPYKIELLLSIETNDIHSLEAHLHQRFASKRVKGEWFRLTDQDIKDLLRQYGKIDT